MTNMEIADLLCDIREARARVKEIRVELIEIAVNNLGISQLEAIKHPNIESLVDGYLIGQGFIQSGREDWR